MSSKKHELLLICIALLIVIVALLFSLFRMPKYNDLIIYEKTEAGFIIGTTADSQNNNHIS